SPCRIASNLYEMSMLGRVRAVGNGSGDADVSNIVRAALVQTEWTGDKASMIDKNVDMARKAAADGAQILCFQEIFSSRYFCTVQDPQYYDEAEEIPGGPTITRMIELARETGMVLVVPIYEK